MSRASAAVLFPDGTTTAESPSHHPLLYSTGRHGCWGSCTCGDWESSDWTTVGGVHGEFGRHLLRARATDRESLGRPICAVEEQA